MKKDRTRTSWPRAAALGTALVALAPLAFAPATFAQDAPQPAPPAEAPAAKPAVTALDDATKALQAADAGRAYVMPDEIVVSAERGVPIRYAGGRDVIERDTITRYPDGNILTVIRRVPGVYTLPEQGNDGKLNIGIRGNSPRRSGLTTLLIDGVPSAEAPYGSTDSDYFPVALERVERIDVMRSGAAVRYGPNSAGGVINFITEGIPEKDTVRMYGRWGSNSDYAVGTTAGGTWDRFGAMVSMVQKGGDGYRDNSDYTIDDGSLKVRYAFNDRDTLTASFSRYLELDAEMPGGLTPEAYEEDPDQSQRTGQGYRGDLDTYSAQFVHEVSPTSSFQILGWYHSGMRELYGFRPNPPPFEQRTVQHSVFRAGALEARYQWETEILGAKNTFFHSARFLDESNYLQYYRNDLAPGTLESVGAPEYVLDADFESQAMAFFNEDVVSLTETLDLAFGARMEMISMDSKARETNTQRNADYDEFLPEVSITWLVLPRTALYGSWHKSFYTPQYETGFDPSSEIYNNVDPEHAKTWEFGTRFREVEGLEFAASYFHTRYTDKIEFVNLPNGNKVTYNVGEALSHGVELSAAYDCGAVADELKGLSFFGTLTELKATAESGENEGNDLPEAPHTLASWGVQYDHCSGAWARIGGSYTDSSFHEPENYTETDASGQEGIIPSVSLWDLAIGWRQHQDGQGLSVTTGITNLFDEDYFRRFGGGIEPGAPRQYFVAASYTIRW